MKNYLLDTLNLSEKDLTLIFKYKNKFYRIPAFSLIWWIISIIQVSVASAIFYGMITALMSIG